jgi:glycosyltransferase involved in cell wall biosynthesis
MVVRMHAEALRPHIDVSVLGCAPKGKQREVEGLFPNSRIFQAACPDRWFRGPGMYSALRTLAAKCDVFHAHMLWDYTTWATWRIARADGKPFVVTPHGSLSSVWRTHSLHKRLYRLLVLDGMLRDVGAIHVLNQDEADACRDWGLGARIEVVPNGLPEAFYDKQASPELAYRQWPILEGRRIMLYLGRLWSQKGLDILPEAWVEAQPDKDWLLVLAGPDYRGYEKNLRAGIDAQGLKSKVLLTGAVSGQLKTSLMTASECFVLPSHSEGFSMALLEAMAAGLPCIFTSECHFQELATCRGGWEIPLGKKYLSEVLHEVCKRSVFENNVTGLAAKALGREKYTSERVAGSLLNLYRSL